MNAAYSLSIVEHRADWYQHAIGPCVGSTRHHTGQVLSPLGVARGEGHHPPSLLHAIGEVTRSHVGAPPPFEPPLATMFEAIGAMA